MSPGYDTREKYERWHMRTCARCERQAAKAANWPDGPICRTCLDKATRTRGCCPGCQSERLLPGRDAAGIPVCRDCAGITRDFLCDRCHFEGRLLARLCERCTLTDRLAALLDDATGHVHPLLVPLFDQLRSMQRPNSGLRWLSRPQPRALLQDLATGRLALTHEAFQQVPNRRAAAFLRDLLMQCGVLPAVDRQLLLFERWLAEHLAAVADPRHARLLHRFATWHQLQKLRTKSEHGPLGGSPTREARQQLIQAGSFLIWLTDRDIPLEGCRQVDLDAWHTEKYATRRPTNAFLSWAMTAPARMPTLTIPIQSTRNPDPMGQHHRIAAIQRLTTDETLPLRSRIAGLLVLLLAQPVSRIVRLTIDDVLRDGDHTTLRLGDPPTPVPAPLADLLRAYIADRPNMATGANPNSRWLFPGRRPGQTMCPDTLRVLLRELDVPAQRGRTAAIRQLVVQMPAPVVAQAFGYHHDSTTRIANEVGSPWSGYASGDHSRQQPPPRR